MASDPRSGIGRRRPRTTRTTWSRWHSPTRSRMASRPHTGAAIYLRSGGGLWLTGQAAVQTAASMLDLMLGGESSYVIATQALCATTRYFPHGFRARLEPLVTAKAEPAAQLEARTEYRRPDRPAVRECLGCVPSRTSGLTPRAASSEANPAVSVLRSKSRCALRDRLQSSQSIEFRSKR